MRKSEIKRKTTETDIRAFLLIDGNGKVKANTGIGFLDHMLEAMGKHGFMDIELECIGDLHVDQHHTVEDIGIVLGKAVKESIGDKMGIKRYGSILTPMDEALSLVVIDISGRAFLNYDVPISLSCGGFDYQLVEEFFRAFAHNAEITLHIKLEYGKNNHHIVESIFKGVGRALNEATSLQGRSNGVLSTKGFI